MNGVLSKTMLCSQSLGWVHSHLRVGRGMSIKWVLIPESGWNRVGRWMDVITYVLQRDSNMPN